MEVKYLDAIFVQTIFQWIQGQMEYFNDLYRHASYLSGH